MEISSVIGDNENKKDEALNIIYTSRRNITQGAKIYGEIVDKSNLYDDTSFYDEIWLNILEKYKIDIGMTTYDPSTLIQETAEIISISESSLKRLNEMQDMLNGKRKITGLGWFLILMIIILLIIIFIK